MGHNIAAATNPGPGTILSHADQQLRRARPDFSPGDGLAGATMRSGDKAFLSAGRSPAEFALAARHSRRVRFLKLALPLGGGIACLAIIAMFVASQLILPRLDPGETKIEDGKLVMRNPKLTGTDSNQRPYNLSAEQAVQDAANPSVITLENIVGKLWVDAKNSALVKAGNGIYDSEAKTLQLSGKVAVDTDDGMSIRLLGANIDIGSGRLTSDSEVVVDTGRARVSSNSLVVENNGRTIIFEKRVRMTIQPMDLSRAVAMPAANKETDQ